MRLIVKVKPGSRRPGLSRSGEAVLISVRERAHDGLANEAVIRAVAAWLNIPASRITIERGAVARNKQLEIAGLDAGALTAALQRL